MAAKLGLVLVAAFVLFQCLTWECESLIVRRDATAAAEKNATAAIDEAIRSFQSGLDDLVKNIQSNELYQNITQSLKSFGDTVQLEGKNLVEKIQGDVNKPKN